MAPRSGYTQELADEICERIGCGETLNDILRSKGNVPTRMTVHRWLDKYPEFAIAYKAARDKGFDAIAESALEIADTPVSYVTVEDSDRFGRKTKRGDAVDHRKLQVWTRLQLLARWSPRYREANNVTVAGDAANPIAVNDQSAASRLATLLATAQARKERESDGMSPDPHPDDYSDLI